MPISSKTLISLACILSNRGELDTRPLEAQLTQEEKIKISKIIEAGACLPEELDVLIEKTKIRIEAGEISPIASDSEPTNRC